MGLRVKPVSALEKCFLDEDINLKTEYNSASCLMDEVFRFGICYSMEEICYTAIPVVLSVESEIGEHISISTVEHIPVKLAAHGNIPDPNYLRKTAGLYPDLLVPLNSYGRLQASQNTESLFIEIDTKGIEKAGLYIVYKTVKSLFMVEEKI